MKKLIIMLLLCLTVLPLEQVSAETPDESNQCSNGGAGKKREDALNKMQYGVLVNGRTAQQEEYNLCMRNQITRIMQSASGLNGFGFDIGRIMRMAQDALCKSQEENLYQYGTMYAISNIPSRYSSVSISDPLTRQLMGILQSELLGSQRALTQYRVPDVARAGVNNVMSRIIR